MKVRSYAQNVGNVNKMKALKGKKKKNIILELT